MYTAPYLNVKGACEYLGLGRATVLRLCRQRPHKFPAVKIGNRYQIDAGLLAKWKDDWYSGVFEI
jgi:DNA binding domain, excisionase family